MAEAEQQIKIEDRAQVFLALDRRDENQILAEMRGEILEDLVYDVTIQGRRVTNLSYAGVKEAVRHRGNIEILDVHTEEVDGEIRALVRVRDLQNRIDVIGASASEKSKPFAYTLAVNKAERNAFAKLIPAKWLATLVDDYLNRGKAETRKQQVATQNPTQSNTPGVEVTNGSPVQSVTPITTDVLVKEGLRQFPLANGLKSVGMLNVTENEVIIVPERPIRIESPTISGFLIPKILEPLKTKYGFNYNIVENGKTELSYILVSGKMADQQIKELQTSSRWAFSKALEKTEDGKQPTA